MIYVRGADSEVAVALGDICKIHAVGRGRSMPNGGGDNKYLFCVGKIKQARIRDQSDEDICDTFMVNAVNVIRECDRLLEQNEGARICVIGSDSGYKWSYDGAYAAAKAGLHRYIECKRLKHPGQQLVGIAPSCIGGTRMNWNRNSEGQKALQDRMLLHPKKRALTTKEVALMIHFLLNVDQGYTSGVVIRMNGGEHCTDRW